MYDTKGFQRLRARLAAYPVPVVPGFTEALNLFRRTWSELERDPAIAPSSAFAEASRLVNGILAEARQ